MKCDRALWEPAIERRVRELLAQGYGRVACVRRVVREVEGGWLRPVSTTTNRQSYAGGPR